MLLMIFSVEVPTYLTHMKATGGKRKSYQLLKKIYKVEENTASVLWI